MNGMKRCVVCEHKKPYDEFYTFSEQVCKSCLAKQDAEYVSRVTETRLCMRCGRTIKTYSKTGYCRECASIGVRSGKYGITPEEYDSLMDAQNGVCAICQKPPGARGFAIDHDHESGVIRGLLCTRCNLAIGQFGDEVITMLRAAMYVKRFQKHGG